jgi:hypothetical protein
MNLLHLRLLDACQMLCCALECPFQARPPAQTADHPQPLLVTAQYSDTCLSNQTCHVMNCITWDQPGCWHLRLALHMWTLLLAPWYTPG